MAKKPPRWIMDIVRQVSDVIMLSEEASLQLHFHRPGCAANEWDDAVYIGLAPCLIEVVEAGPNDGKMVYPKVDNIDLMEMARIFDEVEDFFYGVCRCETRCLTIVGKVQDRRVVVEFYDFPWPNAKPTMILQGGKLRRKRPN